MSQKGVMPEVKKSWIPGISDDQLEVLAGRIRPIHDFGEGLGRCFVRPMTDEDLARREHEGISYLRNIAFEWDPEPDGSAPDLNPVCDITTYHTYGFYGFFKPTIAEVLAQIPSEILDQVVAFEIVGSPDTAADLNAESEALNAGYHVATTRLFADE